MENAPLEFGTEEVFFDYAPKGHLSSSITLHNPTPSVAYFKVPPS